MPAVIEEAPLVLTPAPATDRVRLKFFLLFAITALALLVHGYHYGIEDEGIYLPAVKHHLNSSLYPFDSEFFESQARLMLFDELLAGISGATRLPVEWIFFAAYCLSTFLCVLALRQLAERLFREERARWAAVLLPTILLTLPVAGTALFIMDQHLHPRNPATVALLFALVAALDRCASNTSERRVSRPAQDARFPRGFLRAIVLVAVAAAFHPLMALYGASLVSLIAWRSFFRVHLAALALLVPLGWLYLAPAAAGWKEIVQPYCFLNKWAWYEWMGIFGPLAGLWAFGIWARRNEHLVASRSARSTVFFGLFFLAIAGVITYLDRFATLATLQPMRSFQMLYLFFFLTIGGMMGQMWIRYKAAAGVLVVLLCGGMFWAQRQAFASSPHIEFPGSEEENAWVKAYDWIRENTPQRAYFVMDPDYIQRPGHDTHGFRALAERSMLADQNKDRSAATLSPELLKLWLNQSEARRNWRTADLRRLKKRFGVDWVVLERGVAPPSAGLACPYENEKVHVCRIE